jgi:hypothetical protein
MNSAKFLVSDTLSLKQLPILLAANLISLCTGFMKISSLNHKQMYSLRVQCYSCHTTPDLLLLILMSLLTDTSDISSSKFHIAQEMAICCKPHNSRKWDFRITRQLVYKYTFCQNTVTLYFHRSITYLHVGLLRISQFFLSPIKLCISRV